MSGTAPPEATGLPTEPPALARAVAMLLVTRYRLRLCDPRDSRLGELASDYTLAAAAWTGPRSALVGFFVPPDDPSQRVADLHRRIGAALRWGDSRLQMQPAQRAEILLVALGRIDAQLPAPAHPAVSVGVVWVDPAAGEAGALLPPPPGLPGLGEIRGAVRGLRGGAEAPTLAAVDLAERETVHGGYIAPARRALIATPQLTYALVGAFVVIFLIENSMLNHFNYSEGSYLGIGGIDLSLSPFDASVIGQNGSDWWRFLSNAFLHEPGGLGLWPAAGAVSYLSLHLAINCWSTVVLGRIIEPMYGRLAMLASFVATAFAASGVSALAYSLRLPDSSPQFLGASGGLMGLLGLLFTVGRVQGRNLPAGLVRALRQGVILSLALTVVFGFTTGGLINNYAHLGGFVTGALIGLVVPPVRAIGGSDHTVWHRIALGAVVAVGAAAMLLMVVNLGEFFASNPQVAPPA